MKCGVSLKAQDLQPNGAKQCDYTVHLILAIFLGCFGVHNFYAGYTLRGIAKLLITLLSFGFLSIVSLVWAIIEAVTMENDANGQPFRH